MLDSKSIRVKSKLQKKLIYLQGDNKAKGCILNRVRLVSKIRLAFTS